mmetsp:Transcript_36147/g.85750  ORF Transcript_36147/g.85750 Transcript_36147/m.85750 type:complete len:138 (+) Transcript_36147:1592-2005(+)
MLSRGSSWNFLPWKASTKARACEPGGDLAPPQVSEGRDSASAGGRGKGGDRRSDSGQQLSQKPQRSDIVKGGDRDSRGAMRRQSTDGVSQVGSREDGEGDSRRGGAGCEWRLWTIGGIGRWKPQIGSRNTPHVPQDE